MARYPYLCPMRWSDMDAYGHVNNVQYLTYLEEARIEMLQELIVMANEQDGPAAAGILVAASSIEYRRPLVHRSSPLPIDVWVTRLGAAYFDLAYEVHDGQHSVYATASSRMVPYDFSRERPRRLRPHERAFLEPYLA